MHWKGLPLGVKGNKIVIYLVPHLMPGRNPQTQMTGICIKLGRGGGDCLIWIISRDEWVPAFKLCVGFLVLVLGCLFVCLNNNNEEIKWLPNETRDEQ